MKMRVLFAGAGMLAAAMAPLAHANSAQIVIYNNRYPTTVGQANQGSNCSVCHTGAPVLNPYGLAFKNSAAGPDSVNGLIQIEFLDSDNDNFSNIHEILKFNLPGASGNFPAQANTAPVLNAIGNKTLNEGQTLNFTVTTTDEVTGLNPLLTVTNLPPGATFTDNRNRTATFNWVTDFSDQGTYSSITFTSSDGKLTDTETITITINNVNSAPFLDSVENQVAYVGQTLNYVISGSDPENSAVTFSATGLPAGASLTDNGDGTATLSWTPVAGDIGVHPGVTLTIEDDANQTDSAQIALFVTQPPRLVFGPEEPLNGNHADDEYLDYRADLATDKAGNWVAVWYVSDTGLITAAHSADNGATWSAPIAVSPVDDSDEAPQIATDGAGKWVVVWRSANTLGDTIGADYDILYARSTNNGQSWTDAAPLNPDAATDAFNDQDRGANIEFAGGVWVSTWMKNKQVFAMRSTNAGGSWDAPDLLGNGYVESFPDTTAPRLAGDGAGNWVAVWGDGDPFGGPANDVEIQVATSGDGGATWTPQADLNPDNSSPADDQLPSIATDGSGVWIATWTSQDSLGGTIGSDADILTAKSTDNGATWSAPKALAPDAAYDGFRWDYAPTLTTDRRGTWVCMWHSDGALIRTSYSTDEGATWSFPVIQNALHNDTTRLPQAFADGNGNWLAVWETNENPNDNGYDIDLMIAHAYAAKVDSIARDGEELSNDASVSFTVTFREDVTGVDAGDFAVVTGGGLAGASVGNVVQLSPSEYSVAVNTGSGTGTLSLNFIDNDTVRTALGNVPGGPGVNNGNYIGVESYTIDKTAPVITRSGSTGIASVLQGNPYDDAGATALDDRDGDISGSIVTTNPVNTNIPGTYTVRYNVTDSAGNAAAEVTRTVVVLAATPEGEGEGITPEGALEGEGTPAEGEGVIEGEGSVEGAPEGAVEGEGALEGEGAAEGEGATPPVHSADQNEDERIALSELLRVVQLYSLASYGCAANTEDGYASGSVARACPPHASDFQPQDWAISLNELLRLIQFYNANGYERCDNNEDGYCPR